MNQEWKDFLGRQGLVEGGENFGVQSDELASARDGTVAVPLLDQAVIRASGDDAAGFLHNLMTNDVEGIPADGMRFAGFCTAKGRLLATFLIWREGDDYLLQLAADIQPAMLKKLSMYILRSKVRLADASDERVLIGVAGAQAETVIAGVGATVPGNGQVVTVAGGRAMRIGGQRFVLALDVAAAVDLWPRLTATATPAGLAAWRWLEIAAGQPRVVAATQEAFIPQMVNMELPAVGGVSFHKGCYPGQEIVARTQYLGKIKRRMYRACLDTDFAPGTSVFTPEAGDQHCGALVTVAPSPAGGFECLTVVQTSGADAGEIHVGRPDGPRMSLLPLPYAIT